MKKIIYLMLVAISLFAGKSLAQNANDPLKVVETVQEVDKESIKTYARQTVGQLNDYISYMASRDQKNDSKAYYKDAALKLFINEGKPYTEIIERRLSSGRRVREERAREGVTMEVSWILPNGKVRKNPRAIGKYFDGLIGFKYKSVNIETTDIDEMQVSDIYKIADGRYVCSVYFTQRFDATDGEGRHIGDITSKYVVCHIEVVQNIKEGKTVYIIRLGDIKVEKTEKLYL